MNIFGIMKHLVTMGVVNGGSRAYLVITRISRGLSRTHCPLSSFQIRHNGFTSQSKELQEVLMKICQSSEHYVQNQNKVNSVTFTVDDPIKKQS